MKKGGTSRIGDQMTKVNLPGTFRLYFLSEGIYNDMLINVTSRFAHVFKMMQGRHPYRFRTKCRWSRSEKDVLPQSLMTSAIFPLCKVGRLIRSFFYNFWWLFIIFEYFRSTKSVISPLWYPEADVSCSLCKTLRSADQSFASINRVKLCYLFLQSIMHNYNKTQKGVLLFYRIILYTNV